MDYQAIDALRDRHAAWRLLRAGNASLVLSFLGRFFVEGNRGATGMSEVASALDDHLYVLNPMSPTRTDEVQDIDELNIEGPRFPKSAASYLEDWAGTEAGYLRRFYPAGDDEVHYEITPAFEKAYRWVEGLPARSFVGTESRLHTVVELLRQIVQGTETDPSARLAELHRKRDEIDAEIAAVGAGDVPILDSAGVRDRYQQLAATARDLLSDFREVEDNFRLLDRAAREKIIAWEGSKGELLLDLVGSRTDIAGSDQGRNFSAFYDFLLSEARQDELSGLLSKVGAVQGVDADQRIATVHHDWSEAAERAQQTVRQISEQLRRFLDDQVWENKRVLALVRSVEAAALTARDRPPDFGLTVDEPGLGIALPFERPLYEPPAGGEVESLIPPAADAEIDAELLFQQTFIDQARLVAQIRAALPERSSALLDDIVRAFPLEQGAAEIVGYLAISDADIAVEMDDAEETVLDFADPADPDSVRRARLPKVTVRRT